MIISLSLSAVAFATPLTEKPTVGVESTAPNRGEGFYESKAPNQSKDLFKIQSFGDLIMEGGCYVG
ncbi:MAG: hypothetical protein PWP27_1950 [Clostridiales bacterium]|nr:hypothetical protein [Clostridiales bacterium]MDK2934140.1 hypothetical protein [Clostridiales bacterium]